MVSVIGVVLVVIVCLAAGGGWVLLGSFFFARQADGHGVAWCVQRTSPGHPQCRRLDCAGSQSEGSMVIVMFVCFFLVGCWVVLFCCGGALAAPRFVGFIFAEK